MHFQNMDFSLNSHCPINAESRPFDCRFMLPTPNDHISNLPMGLDWSEMWLNRVLSIGRGRMCEAKTINLENMHGIGAEQNENVVA